MSDDAEKAKHDAMALVEANANAAWKRAAAIAVGRVALRQPYLTADDVIAIIDPSVHTHELRALGPVMTNAAKDEWIEKADILPVNSKRANCHAKPLTVWKSLLFKEK